MGYQPVDGVTPRHGQPPEDPDPRLPASTRVGLGSLALTVAAALIFVGASVAGEIASRRTPSATVPPAVSSPPQVPAPAAGAESWALPEASFAPLPAPDPDSQYYGAQVTALDGLEAPTLEGCPTPRVVGGAEQWRQDVTAQWECVHDAWASEFARLGWSAARPALRFFDGEGSDSDCGHLVAPAFYCASGPGQVYFGGDHLAMSMSWRLAVDEMVIHEYGHHLQYVSGITAARLQGSPGADSERRAELQAICWAGAMTVSNRAVAFGEEDYESWQARLRSMSVDGAHGSRESIVYWGTRGLYAGTLGDCNTWLAPAEAVA